MNWNASYAILLFSSTLITYLGGRLIIFSKSIKLRKFWLTSSIVLNLSMLLFFKYFNFFGDVLTNALKYMGLAMDFPRIELLLPVGISFYTFQSLSYIIDVYRKKIEPEKHFGIYALFVSFFPQIASGPISRAPVLIPQFRKSNEFDYERIRNGLLQMTWGYFKKLVIADRLAVLVNTVFDNPADHHGIEIVVAVIFFTVQIYCDFSGYTDIAIGAAKIMGFDLMKNFRMPYFSESITDFWRRWHISLSTWFRDYLYFPLGGNKKGQIRTYLNLFMVFLISGLWHGAAMTFAIWGALHGFFIVFEKAYKPYQERLYDKFRWNRKLFSFKLYRVLITFSLVSFAWIFFRAKSFADAMTLIQNAFQWNWNSIFSGKLFTLGLDVKEFFVAILATILLFTFEIMHLSVNMTSSLLKQNIVFRWAIYLLAVLAILIFGYYGGEEKAFIYFQF
jgi:alginate O-acetyltransferase complex protein AlgI